ncbi:MAG: hypothetical protein Q4C49_14595 [Bacillota bacterium]|nr:hypothetical protein [Bacillota bacterium]
MNELTKSLACELEKRFEGKEKNTVGAVLHLEAQEGNATHYIYEYEGIIEDMIRYNAIYKSDGNVYYHSFSIQLTNDNEFYFSDDKRFINRTKQVVTWILELLEIKERINTLLYAIEEGGSIHGWIVE